MDLETNTEEMQEERGRRKAKFKKELWLWAKTILIVIVVVSLVRSFLFTNYIVYGQSMMPTIRDGERVVVNKIGYDIFEPKRFDLVIFHATETSDYVKRIIGLPGDHIKYAEDTLYVNGEPMVEAFLEEYREWHPGTLTRDFTLEDVTGVDLVPKGTVFVLGDNRLNSLDSRHIGFVDVDQIVGEANFSYWPPRNIRVFK